METEITLRFISAGGFLVMLGIAWALSEKRTKVPVRAVITAFVLQFLLAVIVLKTGFGKIYFNVLEDAFAKFIDFSDKGAGFLFGRLTTDPRFGATVAFQVLPIVVFVSAVSGILYHFRVLQTFVKGLARFMQKVMRISGAEAVAAALFVFLGIESVTAIGKYIQRMTRSELFLVMTAFMATIASSVMGAYVAFGAEAGHLLAASLMSAPAAVAIAKVMVPETDTPVTGAHVEFDPPVETQNVMDAAASGAAQGGRLAFDIAAMLIAFVGLVAFVNFVLGHTVGMGLDTIFGYGFAPFAVAMGVPWEDALTVGQLLGTKTVLNEFLAYQNLQGLVQEGKLDPRSVTISTYALCGFANFGSLAILIGGLRGIAPERSKEVAELGIKALIAGTLAAFTTACMAGILGG